MRMRTPCPSLLLLAALCACIAVAGCDGAGLPTVRYLRPAVITIEVPEALGSAERPLAEFQHDKHFAALKQEGCKACHTLDGELGLLPTMNGQPETFGDSDAFAEFYHDLCIGCHEDRRQQGGKTGPETCGECHVFRLPTTPSRVPARFDYSLHHRHVQATAEGSENRCGTCHHVYDAEKEALDYKQGAEASCRDCHGTRDTLIDGRKRRSLRNASHLACINCHRKRKIDKTGPTGPIGCLGCHDTTRRAAIKKLKPEQIKRLKIEGQPDRTWVETEGTTANLVPFDHRFHESLTDSCNGCHHETLKPCSECHTVTGSDKGGRVTLEQAHHDATSGRTCVGCHAQAVNRNKACAGCHHMMTPPPGAQACRVCHSGPLPPALQPTPAPVAETDDAAETQDEAPITPAELLGEVTMAALPRPSAAEFPETITIDVEGELYRPTELPHAKIVKTLYDQATRSKLANRFHVRTEVLCAGCHHHSPVGERPPPCQSCHGQAASATQDKPALTNAYHRQCIGCHQKMAHPAQGCTDCHEKQTSAEVSR